MRKKVLSAVFAVALLVAIAVPLSGGGTASASPGIVNEGQPNCHGQTVAAAAISHGGAKQAAADHGFASVKDGQAAIKANC